MTAAIGSRSGSVERAGALSAGPGRRAALAALGVVYGDLGTSPLYALQAVVQAMGGRLTAGAALGVLSLIAWALIIVISVKYCLFVLRADNGGEGGVLALTSLVGGDSFKGRARLLAVMGLLGAALIYGDGVITPAISVLSALEGVDVATPALQPYVMPAAVAVLVAFFLAQRFGAGAIGGAFGPVMLAWFVVIGLLGLGGVLRDPAVLAAIDPRYAVGFLAHGGPAGVLVLGAVFLCVTGGEALYADLGYFGKGPIRLSWYAVVLPALLLSYAGQTALVVSRGAVGGNPFFQLAPAWAVYPLVALATVATIIASQAIVTGAFSMTRQAMQLGWLPGFAIRQTSDEVYGQIYAPVVNWLMMVATVAITIGFRSSDRLAGAYGTAVSTAMLLTTALLVTAMVKVWRWPLALVVPLAGLFLVVDIAFFGANLLKIGDGGWLPLACGAAVFLVMVTWRTGVDAVKASIAARPAEAPEAFLADLKAGRIPRVEGTAVFLTRMGQQAPGLLLDHVRHMGALHRNVIALTVVFEQTPRVPDGERGYARHIGDGFWRAIVRFGFVEAPDLPEALARLKGLDRSIDLDKAVYLASRDLVLAKPDASLAERWRLPLFAFLFRNGVKVVDRFSLPRSNVVEIAREIEI